VFAVPAGCVLDEAVDAGKARIREQGLGIVRI
jgi:hypothetical protein